MKLRYLPLQAEILKSKQDVNGLISIAPEQERVRLLIAKEALTNAAVQVEICADLRGEEEEEE